MNGFTVLLTALPALTSYAQTTEPHQKGHETSTTWGKLQSKVAELEAPLASQHRERYGLKGGLSQTIKSMKGVSQDSGGSTPEIGMGMMRDPLRFMSA